MIISSSIFTNSIVPILTWFILALILHDSDLANVFLITYPFQFVCTLLLSLFGTGANIRQAKENNPNAVWSSMLVGIMLLLICFALPIIFCDRYLQLMSITDPKYHLIMIYALLLMALQGILNFLAEKLYFDDREKTANRLVISFNSINLVLMTLLTLICGSLLIPMCVTLTVLGIFLIIVFARELQKFKFDLNIFRNFKYESASICTQLLMFLIYFFGNKIVFAMGPEYSAALNLVGLCTDAQWDAADAIKKATKVDLAKDRFHFKQHYWQGLCLILILITTSSAMFLALFAPFEISLTIGIIYLLLQTGDLLLYSLTAILQPYTQLKISATLATFGTVLAYVIRTIVTVCLQNPFCEEIGQLTNTLVCYLWFITVVLIYHKQQRRQKL